MKVTVIILLALICCSCKTYNVYLVETKPDSICVVPARVHAVNRFAYKFHNADSLFHKASEEAAKAAYEKTKHLIPR